jgi:serine protease DegQ
MRFLACTAICAALSYPLSAEPPTPAEKPKAGLVKAETKYEIPYRLTDTKHVLVRLKLNGKGPFNLIFDTGAPAVFITKAVAKKCGLIEGKNGWGEFETFEFEGGVKVEKARARVEDLFQLDGMNSMGLAGVELHGVVGYNVLAKFRITYDFTADKLTLVPLDYDPPEPKGIGKGGSQGGLEMTGTLMKTIAGLMGVRPNFETTSSGFFGAQTEERKDGLFVQAVLKRSPADTSGIKVGDKIVSVKMKSIDTSNDFRRAFGQTAGGDKLAVTVERAGEKLNFDVELGKGL